MNSELQFNFSYGDGTSWEQMIAFETAGMMWSDYIKDDMTVNIHVEMTHTLPDNVIGGALPGMVADVNYTNFRNAYQADITSASDRRSFDSLSLMREGQGGLGPGGTWEKFEARIDLGATTLLEDSGELNMTRANAKALGLIAGNDSSLDGYILMNDLSGSSLGWDYNRDWTGSNKLDFLSTAVHEVGHVLGFVSGVDKYQGASFDNMNSFWDHFGSQNAVKNYANDILDYANPLDLFRYSQESLNIDNGRNTIDMSIGTQTYFGPARLWDGYSSGKDTSMDGDGFQASHWKQESFDGVTQGIMDPLMKPGMHRRISDRDLRAMDAIGFDLNWKGNNLLAMNKAETGWQPATGQGTNIATLQERAKTHIAKSLYSHGEAWWVDWWVSNDPAYANYMTRDRSWEIDNMIDQSEVYEGRSSRSGRSYYRQELFTQEAYFSTVDAQYLQPSSTSISELNSTIILVSEVASDPVPVDLATQSNSSTANSEVDSESLASISEVVMNLFSLEAESESIKTVSTDIETELNSELTSEDDFLVSSL
ncbi:MAG: NF038122 family metalloprotease [Cyanobacteria bacterium J06648_1]